MITIQFNIILIIMLIFPHVLVVVITARLTFRSILFIEEMIIIIRVYRRPFYLTTVPNLNAVSNWKSKGTNLDALRQKAGLFEPDPLVGLGVEQLRTALGDHEDESVVDQGQQVETQSVVRRPFPVGQLRPLVVADVVLKVLRLVHGHRCEAAEDIYCAEWRVGGCRQEDHLMCAHFHRDLGQLC